MFRVQSIGSNGKVLQERIARDADHASRIRARIRKTYQAGSSAQVIVEEIKKS